MDLAIHPCSINLLDLQVSKLQSVFASVEAFPVSEPVPPRSSGLRFASGHPYGALRGYRSSSTTGDGSSLRSGGHYVQTCHQPYPAAFMLHTDMTAVTETLHDTTTAQACSQRWELYPDVSTA